MQRVMIVVPEGAAMAYRQNAVQDAAERGEAPMTCFIDQTTEAAILCSINSAFEWLPHCDVIGVYVDAGVTNLMAMLIFKAREIGVFVEYRTLMPEEVALRIYEMLRMERDLGCPR